MYLSRLTFTTLPGHTRQVEEKLRGLRDLVGQAGGTHARVLRTHFASLGAPDSCSSRRCRICRRSNRRLPTSSPTLRSRRCHVKSPSCWPERRSVKCTRCFDCDEHVLAHLTFRYIVDVCGTLRPLLRPRLCFACVDQLAIWLPLSVSPGHSPHAVREASASPASFLESRTRTAKSSDRQREHFDGKEVGSREAGPMRPQERLPRRALTPLGGRDRSCGPAGCATPCSGQARDRGRPAHLGSV